MPYPHVTSRISVLMPAYNAERYILQSVQSVLAQTFEDFELLIVDDCSTDRTADILSSIRDRRLRVFRNEANLGIVGSLNRAMVEARGDYIARIDADDYCLPTRFAKQKLFLECRPDVLLVGTEKFIVEDGQVRRSHQWADPDPAVLRWQFLVSNPVAHPTMMFRADAVSRLGTYLREDFKYAEDFDFSQRLLRLGNLAVLPENLVIYRLHQQNLTRVRRDEMVAKTAVVLSRAYSALLGGDCASEAALTAEHLMAGSPVRHLAVLEQLGALLDRLVTAFLAAHALGENRAARVIAHGGELWWATVQASLRAGVIIPAALGHNRFRWSRESRPAPHRIARSAVSGLVRSGISALRHRGSADGTASRRAVATNEVFEISGIRFDPVEIRREDPANLYTVIDVGAEPDQVSAGAGAIAAHDWGQAIFDRFGLRPIYAVNYAAASRPEKYEPLRRLLDRHACVIGAQLQPSINPPFEHAAASGSDLSAELEERKLRALVGVIQENLRVTPLFFKAGRDGLGPRTMDTLAQLGFAVGFGILPAADLAAGARPYRAASGGMLSVPMTRAQLAPLSPRLYAALPMAASRHVPGLLVRLGLASTVALSPDSDTTAEEQIRLIRSLIGRDYRTFTLHYESTFHARTEADLQASLRRIDAVCSFFFEELGGMPGNPADLVPQGVRESIWQQQGVRPVQWPYPVPPRHRAADDSTESGRR